MICSEVVQDVFKFLNVVVGRDLVGEVRIGRDVDAFYCELAFKFGPEVFDELVVLIVQE